MEGVGKGESEGGSHWEDGTGQSEEGGREGGREREREREREQREGVEARRQRGGTIRMKGGRGEEGEAGETGGKR